MKKIYIPIFIISLVCFVGCSNNTQNQNSTQSTTNASNNNLNNTTANIGNGIRNTVDNAGNLVGNVINDAGTAINDIGNNLNNIVNDDRINTNNNSNMQLINNPQSKTNNIANTNNVSSDLSQKATQIAKDINSIEGVKKSTVIITGQTALIGLDLTNNLNDEQIANVKKLAEAKAKNSNNGIKNAAITASPEIVQRITNLATDIKDGKPISSLADELKTLIRRVTPTI